MLVWVMCLGSATPVDQGPVYCQPNTRCHGIYWTKRSGSPYTGFRMNWRSNASISACTWTSDGTCSVSMGYRLSRLVCAVTHQGVSAARHLSEQPSICCIALLLDADKHITVVSCRRMRAESRWQSINARRRWPQSMHRTQQ